MFQVCSSIIRHLYIMCLLPQVKSSITFISPENYKYIQMEKAVINIKVRVYTMFWSVNSEVRLLGIKSRFFHLLSGLTKIT